MIFLVAPVIAIVIAVVIWRRASGWKQAAINLSRGLTSVQKEQQRLLKRIESLERPTPTAPAPKAAEPLGDLDVGSVPTPPARPTPPPRVKKKDNGLERRFGTQGAVWLGAIALALAGGFLVKYSVEQGLLGPTTRIVMGLIFGLALLGVGEAMVRRYGTLTQGLDAAGIAVLYSVLVAGYRLYGLYPVGVAFVGMLATTVVAVYLALRRGPLVAVLGLLGGFLTPILIESGEQSPWFLLIYLTVLQCGLLVVGRRMRWWPLAALTLIATMIWAGTWIALLPHQGGSTAPVGLLILSTMVAMILSGRFSDGDSEWEDPRVETWLIRATVGLGALLMASLVNVGDFGLFEWGFFALVASGSILLGRLATRYEGLAWFAMLLGVWLLLVWGSDTPDVATTQLVWRVAVGLGALYCVSGYVALWGSQRPDRWSGFVAGSGIMTFFSTYAVLRDHSMSIPWSVQALLLALLFAGLALPISRRRETLTEGTQALSAFAIAVVTFVSIAVPLELERVWITVAWALEIPLLLWVATRMRLPLLQRLVWPLSILVILRLGLNPAVLFYPIGDGLLFNNLLFGYGLTIAGLAGAAWLARRDAVDKLGDFLESAAIGLGFVYLTLAIRQAFHPGDLGDFDIAFAEWGSWVVAWLLYGIGLMVWFNRRGIALRRTAALLVGGIALAASLGISGLIGNPILTDAPVGQRPIFNLLLWVYAVPAALCWVATRTLVAARETLLPRYTGAAALVLGFLTLSLEARQIFRGTHLGAGAMSNAELYSYSLIWILFAIALLISSIVTRGVVVRYGSIAVMAVAVGKVFLVDTAQLQDLYRVLSLFGLGVTLMLLAWIYQKFVFTTPAD